MSERRGGAVQRQEVLGVAAGVDAHEPHRQTGADLTGDARLKQANDTALLVPCAQQQDVGLIADQVQLVAGDEWETAPRQERRAKQADGWWWYTALGAFTPKRCDGTGMGQEERRLLPNFGNELVEIVGGGGTLARLDPHAVIDVVEQAIVAVVDELVFLLLFELLDRQGQLLFDLIHRAAEKVGNARVDLDGGGHCIEHELAGI